MPRWLANVLHTLNLIAGIISLASGIVPVKYAPIVVGSNAAIAAFIGNIQHSYNADGTSQKVGYDPKKG